MIGRIGAGLILNFPSNGGFHGFGGFISGMYSCLNLLTFENRSSGIPCVLIEWRFRLDLYRNCLSQMVQENYVVVDPCSSV